MQLLRSKCKRAMVAGKPSSAVETAVLGARKLFERGHVDSGHEMALVLVEAGGSSEILSRGHIPR